MRETEKNEKKMKRKTTRYSRIITCVNIVIFYNRS